MAEKCFSRMVAVPVVRQMVGSRTVGLGSRRTSLDAPHGEDFRHRGETHV